MLTSKEIEQSEKLTEEYGKPDCRNPAFDSSASPVADYEKQDVELIAHTWGSSLPEEMQQVLLCKYVKDLQRRITTALESTAKERDAEIERLRGELQAEMNRRWEALPEK